MQTVSENNIRPLTSSGRVYVRGKRSSYETIDLVVTLRSQGYSVANIARRIGCHYNTAKKYSHHFEHQLPLMRLGRPPNMTMLSGREFFNLLWNLSVGFPHWSHMKMGTYVRTVIGIPLSDSYLGRIRRVALKMKRKRLFDIALQRKSMRVQLLRRSFRRSIVQLPVNNMIFIDESHFDFRDMTPSYGYFESGVPAEWPRSYYQRESYSLLMSHSYSGVINYSVIDTTQRGVREEDFIRFIMDLMELLPRNAIVVMDNARVHRTELVRDILERYNIIYMYLSPYSPEYNPIELLFAWLKKEIKKEEYAEITILEALVASIRNISPDMCFSCVKHVWREWQVDEPLVNPQ